MEEYIPYEEQLQDPRWLQLRIRILRRDRETCRLCG